MPTILTAEDAAHVRRVCKLILVEHGFRVLEAEDGLEAVSQYVTHRPDVVMLDINMPELDGLGALAQIKHHDPQARVVMLTAAGEQDKVLAAIRAGARDYVVKPFQVRRVLQAVQKLLPGPLGSTTG
jgi:two-component system, chemotaxis family, chemotaxis protein CheY